MPLAAGTRLGAYEITRPVGAGGMGEVYQAYDSRLGRTVAIKVLPPHLATPDRLERFEQEARAASTLNHPNILTIHDVGRDGGTAWFAMEFVDGQTLRDILNAGPVPLKRALDLARQVAEGLARAHVAGIVHRDLKPENVMVTHDGLAKIVDFGIAKARTGTGVPAGESTTMTAMAGTAAGDILGTVGYMSPEQASGRPVDYRADQFALGLLIYELVTRTRPFERPTTAQSIVATIEADPPPIDALNADVPPHLADIVTRLLAKDPADRYDSTRDLARDLGIVLDSLSRRTPASGTKVHTPATSGQPARRGWMPIAAATVAVLVTAAAAAGWLWHREADKPVQTAAEEPERPLIAVRPFRNLSADPQQAYFAAGVTEEIRGQLSQVSALRILGSAGLDGYGDDLGRAARELGLRSTVDGSVRVEGNRVRVTAELVDARTREALWSQQYDRELAGVLAVQSDIAQQIARALAPNLPEAQQARLAKRPTDNLEAYTLYLRTRDLPPFNKPQNLEAIELLKQALKLDPTFAEAQARAAYRMVFMGYYDDPAWVDKGIAEADAALRIDPQLAYAYFTLGTGYAIKGQGARSRQAFLRALELKPSDGGLLTNFSIAEMLYGRLDEAVYLGRRGFILSGKRGFYHLIMPMLTIRADAETRILLDEAVRRTPTEGRVQMMLSILELYEGNAGQALELARATAAREPKNLEMRFHLSDIAYLADGPELESVLASLVEQSPTNRLLSAESVRLRYAYALEKRGESRRAAELAAEAERYARARIAGGDDSPVQRVELAATAALRGETDPALEWLERAFEAGYRDYGVLARDPMFRSLGGNPRFIDLLDRIRRDVQAQRERARTRGLLELESLIVPEGQGNAGASRVASSR
ncbi:MAG TPA: protein kinase [Vicinamibacterales bacterium]